jgi:hypothetical protein
MGVFDPRQGQVLIQPVTEFYRGKAIRQDIADKELDMEVKRKELDMMGERLDLEKRRVRAQEDQVANQEETLRQRREEYAEKVGVRKAVEEANAVIGIGAGFKAGINTGKFDEAGGLAWAEQQFRNLADTLEDDDRASLLKFLDDGDGLTAVELSQIEAEGLATRDQFQSGASGIKPTGKMIEGMSMGLKPGTQEWNDWIKGTGKDGKPLAIETKLQLARDVYNREGQFADISDEEREGYMKVLGMQAGPKGSVTLDWDTADDMAESIIDKTEIGENWIANNDDDFQMALTFSLVRLAKDGRFAGKELEQRALVDALGGDWDELAATDIDMDELIKALAQAAKE